jgi:NTE family protein
LALLHKTHRNLPQPKFEQIAFVLQGGGSLGSYQAGAYKALDEAGLRIDWIAGVSIGAINAAIIAGNRPEERVAKLQGFWNELSSEPWSQTWLRALPREFFEFEDIRIVHNHLSATEAFTTGVTSFFKPRLAPTWLWRNGRPDAVSLYDTQPLRDALSRFVDFDRINSGAMRFSVSAVNIESGNFDYFDSTTDEIRAEHVLASAALPPMFPAVEIDGEFYWDGGLVSNTPLQWIAESHPQRDTLIFQVDLWNTRGQYPTDLAEVVTRQKEIQFASRTRASSDIIRRLQRLKNAVSEALADLPDDVCLLPSVRRLQEEAGQKVVRIVNLIYHAQPHQGATKDFEFSRLNIEDHWNTGYDDAVRTLRHPEALARPDHNAGVATFDVAVDGHH